MILRNKRKRCFVVYKAYVAPIVPTYLSILHYKKHNLSGNKNNLGGSGELRRGAPIVLAPRASRPLAFVFFVKVFHFSLYVGRYVFLPENVVINSHFC